MERTYAEILADVMENGLVNVEQERDVMLAELEEEIKFACHERGMSREQTQEALEYALEHIG
jgi:energy-coupling factor transporter ATP-binding protein EcfA2